MKLQFFSPGPARWDYEMTPCSAVPRIEDAIVLPVGAQRPDGNFDMKVFGVAVVEWWPSEGVVKVFLLPGRPVVISGP